jgi:hypothetical protein
MRGYKNVHTLVISTTLDKVELSIDVVCFYEGCDIIHLFRKILLLSDRSYLSENVLSGGNGELYKSYNNKH